MKKSVEDVSIYLSRSTQSGDFAARHVWNVMAARRASFPVDVRRERNGRSHHTIAGNNPLLDYYYGKPVYRLRVRPKAILY